MSTPDDRQEASEDELLVQRAKQLFDQSVDGLDGQTRSRLNRSRQVALAELASSVSRPWTQWIPVTGVAAVALVVVTLWFANAPEDREALPAMLDLELLMTEDSFEMLQELEFYSWIEVEAEQGNGSGVAPDVG